MQIVDNLNAANAPLSLHRSQLLPVTRAIDVPEILLEIFTSLPKRDQSSTALVCKVWSEVTLGCLWRTLPSLPPLLQILGPIVFRDDAWSWEDPYQAGDWSRLWSYANRVRHLAMNDIGIFAVHSGVSADVLLHILTNLPHNTNGNIIPNLRLLRYDLQDDRSRFRLAALLAPTLSGLHLNLSLIPPAAARQVLRLINSKLQRRIRTIYVGYGAGDIAFGHDLADFLLQQPNLESAVISHRSLPVDLPGSLSECLGLRLLHISTHFEDQDERLHFLDALAKSCARLEELALFLDLKVPATTPGPSVITPLLNLHDLVSLRLAFGLERMSDQDMMPSVGLSWPRLEILHVVCHITLLHSIGDALGKTLRRLEASLSFDGPGRLPPADAIAATALHLEYLVVGASRLPHDRVREVAEYLAVFCPNASIARSLRGNGTVYKAGSPWALVIETIQMVRRIRRGDGAHRGEQG